jgi:Zn-dependent M28 family amino/carboxypeptidase
VNPASAEPWLAGTGRTLDELFALVQAGERLPRFPLVPSLRARMTVERRVVRSQNVAGILPGADPQLSREYVVLTAHLDHLGIGEPVNGDRIYNGALDNAAGVATLLDVATALSERKGDRRPRRSVLFLATTGEEKGLLGSRFFVARPTIDLSAIAAVLNCDMFLPIHPLRVLTAFGMNESDLGAIVGRVARAANVTAQDDPMPQRGTFVRSDQYSFVRKGIPALMIGIGAEPGSPDEQLEHAWLTQRYHAPSDDLQQPIDSGTAETYNRIVLALIQAIGDDPARPRWKSDSFFRRFSDKSE